MKTNTAALLAFATSLVLFPGNARADQASLLHAKKLIEALEFTGQPLHTDAVKLLTEAQSIDQIAAVLDPLCLAEVTINPESRVKGAVGQAKPSIVEAG